MLAVCSLWCSLPAALLLQVFGCEFFLSYGMTECCGKISMSLLPEDVSGLTGACLDAPAAINKECLLLILYRAVARHGHQQHSPYAFHMSL